MNNPTSQKTHPRVPAQIYTTGAYLRPAKHIIDGRVEWYWKVEEFHDDSFAFGEECNPIESSNTLAGLVSI
jgi:hypothetical protein